MAPGTSIGSPPAKTGPDAVIDCPPYQAPQVGLRGPRSGLCSARMIVRFSIPASQRLQRGADDGSGLQAVDRLLGRDGYRADSAHAQVLPGAPDRRIPFPGSTRLPRGRLPGRDVPLDLRYREIPGLQIV